MAGPYVITQTNSVITSTDHAFKDNVAPRTLTVSVDAFLVSTFATGDGAFLDVGGPWTVTVNGIIYSENRHGIELVDGTALLSTITVGTDGEIIAANADSDATGSAIFANHATSITNSGLIITQSDPGTSATIVEAGNGDFTIKNTGTIMNTSAGNAISITGDGKHTITNTGTIDLVGGAFGILATGAAGVELVTNSGLIEGKLDLGDGNDSFTQTKGQVDYVLLGEGANTLKVSGGQIETTVTSGSGVDTFTVSGGSVERIESGAGNDIVKISGKGVVNSADLGDGDDSYTGGTDYDEVIDGGGADTVKLGGESDYYNAVKSGGGADGTDIIDGGTGTFDYYDAGDAANFVHINLDTVSHTHLATTVAGKTAFGLDISGDDGPVPATKDTITGFEQARGGSGDDIIFGNASANILTGNGGTDVLYGFGGNDSLGGETCFGGDGNDSLSAGLGESTLDGGKGNDFLNGGEANDTLTGGEGNDELFGGQGNDTITGGSGKDIMFGGADADVFTFLLAKDSGVTKATRDAIKDFNGFGGGGDKIDLSDIVASTKMGANPSDPFVFTTGLAANDGLGAFTGAGGELRYVYSADGAVLYGDTNGDNKADFSIEVKMANANAHTFDTANDFVL